MHTNLDNSAVVVDARLTKAGRDLLVQNGGSLKDSIKYFALSDIGVDYSLWNNRHPNGSDYYGEKIENMPNMESSVDANQLRYLLTTQDRNAISVPKLSSGLGSGWSPFTLSYADYYSTNNALSLSPVTEPATEDAGYIFTITNTNAISYTITQALGSSTTTSSPDVQSGNNTTISFRAKSISIKPKLVSSIQTTNIIITSISYGACNSLAITVNPPTDAELTSRILQSSK